jgi:hypothetical protein
VGKVVAVPNKEKERALRYGGRKTGKLVRCYQKRELGVFRVEVEAHSGILRRNDISTLDDFLYLPEVVYPAHLQFVEFDWGRLEQHLNTRSSIEGRRIMAGAKRRAASLRRVRRYLNRKGIVNVHRFLVPLAINAKVSLALNRWARHFKKGPLWVTSAIRMRVV